MNKLKYILSASGKFWYFETAKILFQRNQLVKIITGRPPIILRKEKIPKKLIISAGFFNILKYPFRSIQSMNTYLQLMSVYNKKNIDRLVCNFLDKNNEADVLLGLSGVSLNSGRKILDKKKIFICERASSHILYQDNLLADEYKIHNRKYNRIHNWIIENEQKEYEMADIILVPSNFVKNTFDKKNINKVNVLNFNVNTQNFFKDTNIKKSQKYFDILFVGGITLRKGLHYLIDAFNKFKHPNKRLNIVGDHSFDKDFFEKKFNNEKIVYHGHIDHLKLNELYNKAHVFVLPSIEEGFATVILQAAAAGCPVIVSENTGASEFVENNKIGYSVPIRDPIIIKNKLDILSENNNLLDEFSHNATKTMKEKTWSNYVDQLDKLIFNFKKINHK